MPKTKRKNNTVENVEKTVETVEKAANVPADEPKKVNETGAAWKKRMESLLTGEIIPKIANLEDRVSDLEYKLAKFEKDPCEPLGSLAEEESTEEEAVEAEKKTPVIAPPVEEPKKEENKTLDPPVEEPNDSGKATSPKRNGWGKAFRWWNIETGEDGTLSELAAVLDLITLGKASDWRPTWVWYKDGKIDRFPNAEELINLFN